MESQSEPNRVLKSGKVVWSQSWNFIVRKVKFLTKQKIKYLTQFWAGSGGIMAQMDDFHLIFSNLEMFIQGVSLLSEESKLLISPCQSWFIYNSLSSIWPIDVRNVQGPSKNDNQFSILMPDPPISIFPSLINFCLYEDSLILENVPPF